MLHRSKRKAKYKELLIHELIQEYRLNELEISAELGQNANKIKHYMYREIIPHTYYQDSHDKGIKPLINAIYLTNKFTSFEKRLLTELALYYPVETRFKQKHFHI